MIKKTAVVFALAFVAAVGVASPALAVSDSYSGSSSDAISQPTGVAGDDITYQSEVGFFSPGEPVDFVVAGENGGEITSAVYGTSPTLRKAAGADGSFVATFILPPGASGVYSVTATGVESGVVGTKVVTAVTTVKAAGLASTGGTVPVLLITVASSVLAIGIALMVVLAVLRRRRAASAK